MPTRLDLLRRRAHRAAEVLRQPGGRRRLATIALHRWLPAPSYADLPNRAAVRLAYNVLLHRDPSDQDVADMLGRFERGELDREAMLDVIRASGEHQSLGYHHLGWSLHASRCQFVRSLPPARRILDLGGTFLGNPVGAFVAMGYPYDFDELVLVDLPPDDRHPLYQVEAVEGTVPTSRGPVRYAYHSMTDLSAYEDASFDLVYSGQTFEHVSEADGDVVLKEVHRVLRPGSRFALDTPNGRACRLQQDAFVDPDHEVEYTRPQLEAKLAAAGFTVEQAWGLNLLRRSFAEGRFSMDEARSNPGMYTEVDDCYLLALVART